MADKNRERLKKLGLLGSLYVSQAISLMFLVQALPVFMRQQQMSLTAIGLVSLLGLPLIFNFLWSPCIDRYGFTRWGHYRFWIICFQLLTAGATVACALFDLKQHVTAIAVCAFLMCFFFASQDIATDALAVGLLDPNERGLGNGVQMARNYLGAAIGGGGMLVLLDRLGWRFSLLGLALAIFLAAIPIWQHQEKIPLSENSFTRPSLSFLSILLASIDSYRRPGMGRWLIILAVFTASGNIADPMFRPLLVDLGLSLEEIGFLLGVVGNGASMVGAIVAGLWIAQLGRKRSLMLFGMLKAVAIAMYLLPTLGLTDDWILYLSTISANGAAGMGYATTATVMMDKSRLESAGTDYTAQNAVTYLSGFGAMGVSGVIADAIGYRGAFGVSVAIAFFSVILIAKTFENNKIPQ